MLRSEAQNAGIRTLLSGFLLLFCGLGCGAKPPGTERERIPDSPLSQLTPSNHPPLALLARNGDDSAAAAIAISSSGSATQLRQLAAQLASVVSEPQRDARTSIFSEGVVVSFLVSERLPPPFAQLRAAATKTLPDAASTELAADSDPCAPWPASAGLSPRGTGNVAMALVGPEAQIDSWGRLYPQSPTWPASEPVQLVPNLEETAFFTSVGPERLQIALRTLKSRKVSNMESLLSASSSPLSLLLRQTGAGWTLLSVNLSQRPTGTCLSLELEPQGTADPASAGTVAYLTELFLRSSLFGATATDRLSDAAVIAAHPAKAAAIGAWLALPRKGEPEDTPVVTHHLIGPPPQTLTEFQKSYRDTARHPIDGTSRDELGQGQLWFSLYNPCALRAETQATSGQTLGALERVAKAYDGPGGLFVKLGPKGPALIGHAPMLRAGDLGRFAISAAAAAYASLGSPNPSTPHDPTPLLSFAAQLSTDGHPSWLLPHGTRLQQAAATPGQLDRALKAFLNSSLQLDLLTNAGSGQAALMRETVSSLLKPLRELGATPNRCSQPAPPLPAPGEYSITTASAEASAVLVYPIAEASKAAPWFLSHSAGVQSFFNRLVRDDTGQFRARALRLGHPSTLAALAVSVHVNEPKDLARAINTLRKRLGTPSRQQPKLSAERGGKPNLRSPLDRLFELAAGADSSPPPTQSELIRFISDSVKEDHLLIVYPTLVD